MNNKELQNNINATIDNWVDDILFYFSEYPNKKYLVARYFKSCFFDTIQRILKEMIDIEKEM